MKTLLLALGICVAAVIGPGCASTQPATTDPRMEASIVYPVGFDQAWGAIVAELATEYPFEILQKDSGLLQTKLLAFGSGWGADTGLSRYGIRPRTLLGTWNDSRMKLTIVASKEGEQKTRVTAKCAFQGFENNVTKSWIVWESNGRLEGEIQTRLTKRLGAGSAEASAPIPVVNPPVTTEAPPVKNDAPVVPEKKVKPRF